MPTQLRFTLEYWPEPEGGYGGQLVEMPGVISQGEDLVELRENVLDALALMLEISL